MNKDRRFSKRFHSIFKGTTCSQFVYSVLCNLFYNCNNRDSESYSFYKYHLSIRKIIQRIASRLNQQHIYLRSRDHQRSNYRTSRGELKMFTFPSSFLTSMVKALKAKLKMYFLSKKMLQPKQIWSAIFSWFSCLLTCHPNNIQYT